MSFVEQEDVFDVVEKLLVNLFKNFSSKKILNEKFVRIPFKEAMKKYGTDKPDLRNPLIIQDITDLFRRDDVSFDIFKRLVKSGSLVRAIITKNIKSENGDDKFLKIVKNITSKGFVRSNYEEKLVDLSDVRINLKTKN